MRDVGLNQFHGPDAVLQDRALVIVRTPTPGVALLADLAKHVRIGTWSFFVERRPTALYVQ
jgi:hypothetical protein